VPVAVGVAIGTVIGFGIGDHHSDEYLCELLPKTWLSPTPSPLAAVWLNSTRSISQCLLVDAFFSTIGENNISALAAHRTHAMSRVKRLCRDLPRIIRLTSREVAAPAAMKLSLKLDRNSRFFPSGERRASHGPQKRKSTGLERRDYAAESAVILWPARTHVPGIHERRRQCGRCCTYWWM